MGPVYVYRCVPHPDVVVGHVAVNSVMTFGPIRDYLVPLYEFSLKLVTLEVTWLNEASRVSGSEIANNLRTQLDRHVLTKGQTIMLNYDQLTMLARVTSTGRGLVDLHSEFCLKFV